jgi:hypothetical protein
VENTDDGRKRVRRHAAAAVRVKLAAANAAERKTTRRPENFKVCLSECDRGVIATEIARDAYMMAFLRNRYGGSEVFPRLRVLRRVRIHGNVVNDEAIVQEQRSHALDVVRIRVRNDDRIYLDDGARKEKVNESATERRINDYDSGRGVKHRAVAVSDIEDAKLR